MSNEKIQISYLESNTVCTDVSPVWPCFTSKPPGNLYEIMKTKCKFELIIHERNGFYKHHPIQVTYM